MSQVEQLDKELQPLDPAIRRVWRIKLALFWLVGFGAAVVYDLVTFFGGGDGFLPTGVASGGVLILAVVVVYYLPSLRYRFWRYALRNEELYLERGILNRVRTIVPLRRIQHLDVSQDVLEREFDLGKLIVHTAGSRSSEVVLPGLSYEEAQSLRDTLKDYILEDAV